MNAKTNYFLLRAYRFFRAHAGGIVGENAKTALHLAKAERDAVSYGIEFTTEPDFVGQYHDGPKEWGWGKKDILDWEKEDHECIQICATGPDGEVLASLCGIWDADQNYRRIVRAELAAEAIEKLEKMGATR